DTKQKFPEVSQTQKSLQFKKTVGAENALSFPNFFLSKEKENGSGSRGEAPRSAENRGLDETYLMMKLPLSKAPPCLVYTLNL
ncbi:MAG: hypothetical protein RSC41_00810, partial [Oscillospiraceae bacterium]